MKRGFQIGTLFGIPFYLDFSWVAVAVLMTISYTLLFATELGWLMGLTLGLLSVVVIFGSVLAHELGHSLVAQRFGIEVKSISLFLLGGMAAFDKEPAKPWQGFVTAAAGPLVSVALYFVFGLLGQTVPQDSVLSGFFSLAQNTNLMLALFNLLPGLPLDGGQMLKALVWGVTKDFNKGVQVAAVTGQIIGWALVALGGWVVGVSGNFNGLFLALLGWFIQSSARTNVQVQSLNQRLEKLTVADSLQINGTVSGNLPFSTYHETAKGDLSVQHLVLWQDEVVGIISPNDGANLLPNLWGYYQVRQLMTPVDSQLPSVGIDIPLSQVVGRFDEQTPKLMVRSLEGRIVGIISPETIRRTLTTAA
ncbi:site-2 protease family protein [Candidatus Cyanaurora vandensis]|uniref:site-2 protease family protein n=1 Tax=Candidatus Cyanaurora vandensis TaxID=2714958 RepID=UPI00257FBFC5|nr:site-2 protease family protein [Candidatus Cyanaurora vandensis]